VCVASGPSFSEAQAEQIVKARAEDKCRVIVVNDNYKRVPNADLLYACDGLWWDKNILQVRKIFSGALLTSDNAASAHFDIPYIPYDNKAKGLSKPGSPLNLGSNSGYAAVDLAFHHGTKKIILVGYDMQRTDGKTHWFGEHENGLWNYHPDDLIASWARNYYQLAIDLANAGVDCVNCTIDSALTCFRRSVLEWELPP
jgi:hypothetical protein